MGTRLRTSIGLGCAALALGLAAAPAAAGVRASSSDFSAASALVRGAASGNAIRVGIATDEIRSMAPADYFGALRDVGMTAHREVIGWDPSNPTTIPDRDLLRRAVDAAAARGVEVVFAVTSTTQNGMGANPGALSAPGAAGAFANFVQIVARTYPEVRTFVVGNEPNVSFFWKPQFNGDGTPASGAAYADLLAQAYDALKAVNPGIRVSGGALAARGNDDPAAPSNISTSPVQFIHDMGVAYRASGRTRPIMDEMSFHPYPSSSSDPLSKGFAWPNAGVANLDRLKQAVWDAFSGTAQPTFEEGLRFNLDETGWQTKIPESSAGAYYGRENVAAVDEGLQAQIYSDLIRHVACDVGVNSLYLYRLVDEPNLVRWQSGLIRADQSRRPSYASVKQTLAETGGRCQGDARVFRHRTDVVGAKPEFQLGRRPVKATAFAFTVTAEEDATYEARIFRVRSARGASKVERQAIERSLAQRTQSVATATGKLNAHWTPRVNFPSRRLKAGHYVYAVKLAADMNPQRTSSFVSGAFRVG